MSTEKINQNIANFLNKPADSITDDTELRSLVHDSFVLVELVMGLQEDFSVRILQEDLTDVTKVGDLVKVVNDKLENK